jgi:nitric oxide reductase NorD protein
VAIDESLGRLLCLAVVGASEIDTLLDAPVTGDHVGPILLHLRSPGHLRCLEVGRPQPFALRAGSGALDRVHLAMRAQGHDLAVTALVDVSLSTDAWVDGYRVLDVEKEAVLVLAHGLSACGHRNSILTFTSRRRSWVQLENVKASASR